MQLIPASQNDFFASGLISLWICVDMSLVCTLLITEHAPEVPTHQTHNAL